MAIEAEAMTGRGRIVVAAAFVVAVAVATAQDLVTECGECDRYGD